jgi:predicted  nucleic acid-binding Zn-ribbon protein
MKTPQQTLQELGEEFQSTIKQQNELTRKLANTKNIRNELAQLLSALSCDPEDQETLLEVRDRLKAVKSGHKHEKRLDEIPDDVA